MVLVLLLTYLISMLAIILWYITTFTCIEHCDTTLFMAMAIDDQVLVHYWHCKPRVLHKQCVVGDITSINLSQTLGSSTCFQSSKYSKIFWSLQKVIQHYSPQGGCKVNQRSPRGFAFPIPLSVNMTGVCSLELGGLPLLSLIHESTNQLLSEKV